MADILKWLIVFVTGELLALLVFSLVRMGFQIRTEEKRRRLSLPLISILKGILERFTLFIGLTMQLPHIFTLFGALKIGTRLDADKGQRVSNDYFLVGNLISVLFVLLYHYCYKSWIS